MQYVQRKLQRSVTEIRRSLRPLPKASVVVGAVTVAAYHPRLRALTPPGRRGSISPTMRVAALLSCALGLALAACGRAERVHLAWAHVTNAEQLRAEMARARAEKKPVVVETSAAWCGWCKRLDETIETSPEVVSRMLRFHRVRVDMTNMTQDVYEAIYREVPLPQSLPGMVFLDMTGTLVPDATVAGYVGASVLVRTLDGVR